MVSLTRIRLLFGFVFLAIGAELLAQSVTGEAQQALRFEQQHQFQSAAAIWQQIVTRNPKQAQAWAHLGLMRAMELNYPGAVVAYNKALELDPTIKGLRVNLGLALFKEAQFKEALPVLKAAAVDSPQDARPKLLIAMISYGMSQYEEAIPYFEQSVNDSPDNLHLRMLLAESCLRVKRYECTLEEYKEILIRQPESAEAYMLAGEAFDGLGENAKAIEQFQHAATIAPHQINIHFGLGYLYWEKGQLVPAQQEFALELANDPNHVQALAYLGDIAIKNHQETLATSYLKRAIAQPGAGRLAYLDLGILNAEAKQFVEARSNFEQAIRMNPNAFDAHWRLARLYEAMGQRELWQHEIEKLKLLHAVDDQRLADHISPISTQ